MPDGPWDKYQSATTDSAGAGPWTKYGAPPPTAPPDDRNDIQKSFDENTKMSPSEPLLETGLKSVVGAVGRPFVHPLDAAKGMAKAVTPDPGWKGMAESALGPAGPVLAHTFKGMASGGKSDYQEGGLPYAATKMAGDTFGNVALGAAGGEGMSAIDEAVPQMSRAGAKFESLSKDLANHPVPLNATLKPLQRVTELGVRGGTLPKPASDLLTRSQAIEPMNYPEIRDYHSNMSDLSRDAMGSMNGKMSSQIGKVNKGLYSDTYDALKPVGRSEDFASAMSEFRKAARMRDVATLAKDKIIKYAVPAAVGAGGLEAYNLLKK